MSDTVTSQILAPTPIVGGWRVRETDRYWVDVLTMAFGNLRIVITPKSHPEGYDRGWCYHEPLMLVVLRCGTFDPESGEEPTGWVKEAGTERRACGSYIRGPRVHDGFDAGCVACGDSRLA